MSGLPPSSNNGTVLPTSSSTVSSVSSSFTSNKREMLEKRMMGHNENSSDSLQLSSQVGFATQTETGKFGFDHFPKGALPSTTPLGPSPMNRTLSPSSSAANQLSSNNVNTQSQTKMMDEEAITAPPVTLTAGIMASVQAGTAISKPAPSAMNTPTVSSSSVPKLNTAAAPATTSPSTTISSPKGSKTLKPSAAMLASSTASTTTPALPPAAAAIAASGKRKASPSPTQKRETPGSAGKNRVSASSPEPNKKAKLNPTSLVDNFSAASSSSTKVNSPPNAQNTTPPAAPNSPPRASAIAPNTSSPHQAGVDNHAAKRKDITSYFGGGGASTAPHQKPPLNQQHSLTASSSTLPLSQQSDAMDAEGDDVENVAVKVEGSDDSDDVMILDGSQAQNHHVEISSTTMPLPSTPAAGSAKGVKTEKKKRGTASEKATGEKPASKKKGGSKGELSSPLAPTQSNVSASSSAMPITPPTFVNSISSTTSAADAATAQNLQEWETALQLREKCVKEREALLESRSNLLQASEQSVDSLTAKVESLQKDFEDYRTKIVDLLPGLFRSLCEANFNSQEEKLLRESVSIGRLVTSVEPGLHLHASASFVETWEEGENYREARVRLEQLTAELKDLTSAKQEITRKRRAMTRLKGGSASVTAAAASAASMDTDENDGKEADGFKKPAPVSMADEAALFEQDELIAVRMIHVKQSLTEYENKLKALDLTKKSLVRAAKLHADSRASKFNTHPLLHDRYVVLEMLGKGGFSEVYKAFDLQELRYVACKIHQLNSSWTEQRKISYTRHATREYNIHKTLQHARVVQLYDVFAIDVNAFCTVLQYCDGNDLDMYLKLKHTLGEREARTIIHQVFAGLKYLNEQKQKIIHYDLKPGNILFHNGEVKITDFGLSKLTPEGATDGIELTSQGAGCVAPDTEVWLHDGTIIRADQLQPHHLLLGDDGQPVAIVPNTLIGTVDFPMPPSPGQYMPPVGDAPPERVADLPGKGVPLFPGATPSGGWKSMRRIVPVADTFEPITVSDNHIITVGSGDLATVAKVVDEHGAITYEAQAWHFPSDCLDDKGKPIPGYSQSDLLRGGYISIQPQYKDLPGVRAAYDDDESAAQHQAQAWNASHGLLDGARRITQIGDIAVSEFEQLPQRTQESALKALKYRLPIVFQPENTWFRIQINATLSDMGCPTGVAADGIDYTSHPGGGCLMFRAAQLAQAVMNPDIASSEHLSVIINIASAASFPSAAELLEEDAAGRSSVELMAQYIIEVTAWRIGLWACDLSHESEQEAEIFQKSQLWMQLVGSFLSENQRIHPLEQLLSRCGLNGTKHRILDASLPSRLGIQQLPVRSRLSFLAGLIDGSGDRHCDDYHLFESQHQALAEWVCVILRQTGFNTARPLQNGRTWQLTNIVADFTHSSKLPLACLSKRLKGTGARAVDPFLSSLRINPVNQAAPVGLHPVVSFQVANASERHLLADGTITHNTYWYLPPECFAANPKISSKVDVWSAGVVLYQMIYGRKPFGHGQSAEALLSSRTMHEAKNLEFPNQKKDAPLTATQEFIKSCLRFNPAERPDILHVLEDKYFSVKM